MIDLHSDMLGRRTEAAMAAMAAAAADPPEMDDWADRHKRALEDEAAATFGFEAALFLPTCTMANQIAIRLAATGGAVLAEQESHLALRAAAAATEVNGATLRTLTGARGHLAPDQVRAVLQDARVCLVWLENTHNAGGGTVMPQGWLAEIAAACRTAGVPLHIDGSRLWNASVASGHPVAALARGADSLAVSLNKCVDAPAGALPLGGAGFMRKAAEARQALGGHWRPVGMLAAVALAAIRDVAPRIEAVHARARRLAELLAERVAFRCDRPDTNIVMLHLADEAAAQACVAALKAGGVQALGYGVGRVRFVLHSNVEDRDVEAAADIVARTVARVVP
jgi:threonine aldolase